MDKQGLSGASGDATGPSQQAAEPVVSALRASVPDAGTPEFMREFQMTGGLIAHFTDSIRTYAKWTVQARDNLAAAMERLEQLLSKVEPIAADPFAAQGMSGSAQDPQGLDPKDASPVPQGCAITPSQKDQSNG